jgi:diacylglycerol kinase (ATP)
MVIIANPVSGRGRGSVVGREVARRLAQRGVRAELILTEKPGDGTRLAASALGSGSRTVVACGGDGTVHETAAALAHSQAVLGIIPCGRGNDLARALAIPRDLEGALAVLVGGEERRIDLGQIGEHIFCAVASVGFDAEVAARARAGIGPFSGTLAYVAGMLTTLVRFRSPAVHLEWQGRGTDGKEIPAGSFDGEILLAAVANTPTYGGGMRIAPLAICDDGWLDACIVRALPRHTVLRSFPRIFAGTHAELPFVRMERISSLRIETSPALWVYADGEPMGLTPATIEVARGALKVLCPAAASTGLRPRARAAAGPRSAP